MLNIFRRICAAAALAAACTARAEVTPVLINLSETSPSYTVPATNILLIEHGYVGESSGFTPYLIISNGASVVGMRVDSWFRKITPLQPSLKVPAGSIISATSLSTNLGNSVTLCGLLITPNELYAGVPSTFEGLARVGGNVQALAALDKPRPVRIRVEQSPDLQSWTRSTNAVATGPIGNDIQITIPANSALAEFYRLDARLRRGPGGL
jgi:hypothetical protein